jgi:hypothetical protein
MKEGMMVSFDYEDSVYHLYLSSRLIHGPQWFHLFLSWMKLVFKVLNFLYVSIGGNASLHWKNKAQSEG